MLFILVSLIANSPVYDQVSTFYSKMNGTWQISEKYWASFTQITTFSKCSEDYHLRVNVLFSNLEEYECLSEENFYAMKHNYEGSIYSKTSNKIEKLSVRYVFINPNDDTVLVYMPSINPVEDYYKVIAVNENELILGLYMMRGAWGSTNLVGVTKEFEYLVEDKKGKDEYSVYVHEVIDEKDIQYLPETTRNKGSYFVEEKKDYVSIYNVGNKEDIQLHPGRDTNVIKLTFNDVDTFAKDQFRGVTGTTGTFVRHTYNKR